VLARHHTKNKETTHALTHFRMFLWFPSMKNFAHACLVGVRNRAQKTSNPWQLMNPWLQFACKSKSANCTHCILNAFTFILFNGFG
jgi:hypothetical protein